MISNSYSTARMWALTKRAAVENRRNILISLGVMFGLIFLFSLLYTRSSVRANTWRSAEEVVVLYSLYTLIAGFAMTIIGSLTFSSMSTKSKRISNLMLPAKQSEKFISQCLLYVVGGNLVMTVLFLISDTLSSLIFGLSPGWCSLLSSLGVKQIINFDSFGFSRVLAFTFFGLWLFLFSQAVYVLGSAWWPRKSFLKTYIALLALQIFIPIIMPWGLIGGGLDNFVRWCENPHFSTTHFWIMIWCTIFVLYVLLAGVYYLAWQRYRRLEVVKKFL